MPRGGRSSSRGSSSGRSTRSAPAPARAPQQSAPAKSGGGMMSGLGGMMMQGMAFGAGSEIAHSALRAVMGGSSHQEQTVDQQPMEQSQQSGQQQSNGSQNMCSGENGNFVECLKFNNNTISSCQNYFDLLKSCEQKYN